MSSAAIQEAFDAFLEPRVPNGMPVAWEDVQFTPPAGQPWLATQMIARASRYLGPGRDAVEELSGTYQVSVYFPSGLGVRPVSQMADQVAALFRRGDTLTTPGGISAIVIDAAVPPVIPQPGWVMVPVQVNWVAHKVPS